MKLKLPVDPTKLTMMGAVRKMLRLATAVSETIPGSEDSFLQKAVKTISLVDLVQNELAKDESEVEKFARDNKLTAKRGEQLVSLFFETPLRNAFQLHDFKLSDHVTMTRATHPKVGAIHFARLGSELSARYYPAIFHEPGVDPMQLLPTLWEHFDGRMNVRIKSIGKLKFASFPLPKAEMFGSAIDRVVRRHLRFQVDNVPRSYIYVGPPGTGKSLQVMHVATRIGDRILRLDAPSLSRFEADEMAFVLGSLQPDVLVVDDVDRGGIADSDSYRGNSRNREEASLLSVLEWIKLDHPGVALLLTANDAEKLPEPMRRPGRIDEIITVNAPNVRDRKAILEGYMELYLPESKHLTARQITDMVKRTDRMGAAWLHEIVLQLRYSDLAEVNKLITGMKELGSVEIGLQGRRRRRTERQRSSKKKVADRLKRRAENTAALAVKLTEKAEAAKAAAEEHEKIQAERAKVRAEKEKVRAEKAKTRAKKRAAVAAARKKAAKKKTAKKKTAKKTRTTKRGNIHETRSADPDQ